jgi:predicted DNA-binding antitoxin AbrB/MazE fold protein
MSERITVIYRNGALHPLTPMELQEGARVQIRVERVETPTDIDEHRRLVREALVAAGLSLPATSIPPTSKPISAERREELAHLFATGGSLSSLIAEEREGRG